MIIFPAAQKHNSVYKKELSIIITRVSQIMYGAIALK